MDAILMALKAMAEPTRLRLLALCAQRDLTVSELAFILGQSQPRISRHLKLLADAGLLERFREGAWVFHRLLIEGSEGDIARRLVSLLPMDDNRIALDRQRLGQVQSLRAAEAADYFSHIAPKWDRVRSLYVDEKEVEGAIGRLLPERVDDLLDIGTGTGRVLEVVGPRAGHAEGIDLSHEMLTVARANLSRTGLDNCGVRKGDMYRLPFAPESFDAVTIHQVLHFADDPVQAIAEAARVLRPGGHLVVADFATHNLECLREEHAHRRLGFSDSEISGWFSDSQLERGETVRLPGDPLTVTLWQAEKSVEPDTATTRTDR